MKMSAALLTWLCLLSVGCQPTKKSNDAAQSTPLQCSYQSQNNCLAPCRWDSAAYRCLNPNEMPTSTVVCSQLPDSYQCSQRSGQCAWNGTSCVDRSLVDPNSGLQTNAACSTLDSARCNADYLRCRFDVTQNICVDKTTTSTCYNAMNPNDCSMTPNCFWNGMTCADNMGGGTLVGGQCNMITNQMQCANQPGCSWYQQSVGVVMGQCQSGVAPIYPASTYNNGGTSPLGAIALGAISGLLGGQGLLPGALGGGLGGALGGGMMPGTYPGTYPGTNPTYPTSPMTGNCSYYTTQPQCQQMVSQGCSWNYSYNQCQSSGGAYPGATSNCSYYTTQPQCQQMVSQGCSWNYSYNQCQSSGSAYPGTYPGATSNCSYYTTQPQCQQMVSQGCSWNYSYNQCQSSGGAYPGVTGSCSSYMDQYTCQGARCTWSTSYNPPRCI